MCRYSSVKELRTAIALGTAPFIDKLAYKICGRWAKDISHKLSSEQQKNGIKRYLIEYQYSDDIQDSGKLQVTIHGPVIYYYLKITYKGVILKNSIAGVDHKLRLLPCKVIIKEIDNLIDDLKYLVDQH